MNVLVYSPFLRTIYRIFGQKFRFAMNTDSFALRHIGPQEKDVHEMLKTIGAESIDQLIDETVPKDIRLKKPLNLAPAMSEHEFLNHIQTLGAKNKIFKTYIGLGYHNTHTPSVIKRNILELFLNF